MRDALVSARVCRSKTSMATVMQIWRWSLTRTTALRSTGRNRDRATSGYGWVCTASNPLVSEISCPKIASNEQQGHNALQEIRLSRSRTARAGLHHAARVSAGEAEGDCQEARPLEGRGGRAEARAPSAHQ